MDFNSQQKTSSPFLSEQSDEIGDDVFIFVTYYKNSGHFAVFI